MLDKILLSVKNVKNIIPSLKNNPDKDKQLGDEDKKFKF